MRRLAVIAFAVSLAGCTGGGGGRQAPPAPEPEVETSGYVQMGVSNDGLHTGAGYRVKKGRWTLGLEF